MADVEKQRLAFATRLNKVLDEKGYAVRGRAQKILAETGLDISDRAINKWLKGESIPDHSNLAVLSSLYHVSFDWLATGHGEMDKRSDIVDFTRDEPARDVIQRLTTSGHDQSALRSIPFLNAQAACGNGVINGDYPDVIGRYEISEEFLARLGLPITGEGLILIESDGDSMMPSIPSQTPLLVNTKERDFTALVTGKVYVFCADGEMLCKRIYRNLDSTITLKSDNTEAYEDITVNREKFNEFHILGRVKFAFVEM